SLTGAVDFAITMPAFGAAGAPLSAAVDYVMGDMKTDAGSKKAWAKAWASFMMQDQVTDGNGNPLYGKDGEVLMKDAGLLTSLFRHAASGAQMGLTIGPVLAAAQMPLSAITKNTEGSLARVLGSPAMHSMPATVFQLALVEKGTEKILEHTGLYERYVTEGGGGEAGKAAADAEIQAIAQKVAFYSLIFKPTATAPAADPSRTGRSEKMAGDTIALGTGGARTDYKILRDLGDGKYVAEANGRPYELTKTADGKYGIEQLTTKGKTGGTFENGGKGNLVAEAGKTFVDAAASALVQQMGVEGVPSSRVGEINSDINNLAADILGGRTGAPQEVQQKLAFIQSKVREAKSESWGTPEGDWSHAGKLLKEVDRIIGPASSGGPEPKSLGAASAGESF
ncbi:MAG: hypothetical protein AAB356_09045, partial [Deltaproteobacteria bacterium]